MTGERNSLFGNQRVRGDGFLCPGSILIADVDGHCGSHPLKLCLIDLQTVCCSSNGLHGDFKSEGRGLARCGGVACVSLVCDRCRYGGATRRGGAAGVTGTTGATRKIYTVIIHPNFKTVFFVVVLCSAHPTDKTMLLLLLLIL